MDPATDRFDACADAVMTARGAFVPWDPLLDGPSAHGVGRGLLSVWTGGPADVAALRALSRQDAARILRGMIWGRIGAARLAPGPDLALFAYAVDAGIMQAMADLQDELAVPRSGAPDPMTLAAAAARDPAMLADAIRARHAAWRRAIPRSTQTPHRVLADAPA